MQLFFSFLVLVTLLSTTFASRACGNAAGELKVAVASNFATTARLLVELYAQQNGDAVFLRIGSTGKHAAQIQHGLDVDVFLAADSERPLLLARHGFATPDTHFEYAHGRLALWSYDPSLVKDKGQALRRGEFNHLAVANPKLAPYGRAALEFLDKQGLLANLANKLVRGDSVTQALQFVSSESAELGLLAYSQIKHLAAGSHWLIPGDLHSPIVQTGIIVRDSTCARRFVAFLQSDAALSIIEQQGYQRP